MYICTVYIYVLYIYRESSSAPLRSNEDLEGPECSNYCYSCERCISLVATLPDQQTRAPTSNLFPLEAIFARAFNFWTCFLANIVDMVFKSKVRINRYT